jgi:hypothetical protein
MNKRNFTRWSLTAALLGSSLSACDEQPADAAQAVSPVEADSGEPPDLHEAGAGPALRRTQRWRAERFC